MASKRKEERRKSREQIRAGWFCKKSFTQPKKLFVALVIPLLFLFSNPFLMLLVGTFRGKQLEPSVNHHNLQLLMKQFTNEKGAMNNQRETHQQYHRHFETIGNRSIAIFYNVFTAQENVTMDIVHEQLTQLSMADNSSGLLGAPLFYSLAGKPIRFPCPQDQFQCRILQHDVNGSEANTLQALHEYCQAHNNHNVIYMHTKGSFNPQKGGQAKLRQALTLALHQCSKSFVQGEETCDVCSLRFSPLPHWHNSGNMFWATCRHINRLLEPRKFEKAMEWVLQGAPEAWQLQTAPLSHLGAGRFAYEHWVHTHPRVVPCDVLTNSSFTWRYPKKSGLLDQPQFAEQARPAPHKWLHERYWKGLPRQYPAYPNLPFFCDLRFRLYEGCTLYNTLPSLDSWIWDFYQSDLDIRIHHMAESSFPNCTLLLEEMLLESGFQTLQTLTSMFDWSFK